MEYNVLNNAKVVRDEISQGKNFRKQKPEVHPLKHFRLKILIKSYKIA